MHMHFRDSKPRVYFGHDNSGKKREKLRVKRFLYWLYWDNLELSMLAAEGQDKAKRPGQHRSRSMRRVAKFIRRKFNLVSKAKQQV